VRRGRVQMHTSLGPASRGELARRCSDRGAEEEWQHPGCETAGEHACVGSAAVLWPPSPPVHCLLAFSPAPGSSQRLPTTPESAPHCLGVQCTHASDATSSDQTMEVRMRPRRMHGGGSTHARCAWSRLRGPPSG
jgi:hypothetical protein